MGTPSIIIMDLTVHKEKVIVEFFLCLHIAKVEEQMKSLQLARKLLKLKHLLKTDVDELLKSQFGITRLKDSDSDINFYTEFPNYETPLASQVCPCFTLKTS